MLRKYMRCMKFSKLGLAKHQGAENLFERVEYSSCMFCGNVFGYKIITGSNVNWEHIPSCPKCCAPCFRAFLELSKEIPIVEEMDEQEKI
jgi:hypothetical protein